MCEVLNEFKPCETSGLIQVIEFNTPPWVSDYPEHGGT